MDVTANTLEGKTAVVIGGTSGIGRTLSLGLAKAGADVVASARSMQNVERVAVEIEACGRRTLRVACDLRSRTSVGGAARSDSGRV